MARETLIAKYGPDRIVVSHTAVPIVKHQRMGFTRSGRKGYMELDSAYILDETGVKRIVEDWNEWAGRDREVRVSQIKRAADRIVREKYGPQGRLKRSTPTQRHLDSAGAAGRTRG